MYLASQMSFQKQSREDVRKFWDQSLDVHCSCLIRQSLEWQGCLFLVGEILQCFFFCHSVVRKDDCTSNYKVAEKSIAIFPQLGAIMIIIRYIFW